MNVAVLGCGIIGGGVVEILENGVEGLTLTKILARRKQFENDRLELYTEDVEDILNDSSIDVVVETMGGHDFSYECIKRALNSNKHVVSANKEVIALHLKELTELAEKNNRYLMYEASAGGGIPILKTLSNLANLNETVSVSGILNGTTNYMLTRMQDDGLDYATALKEAQQKGYAEKDPTSDVEGLDMLRKIAIISMLCFKQEVSIDDIYHFGISEASAEYIKFVNDLGYTLKYTCFADNKEDFIDVGVEPVLVKSGSVVASVKQETNIIQIRMEPNGELLFVGKGAGRTPTAAAIVSDLVTIKNGGEKMIFKAEHNKKVGISDSVISAVVDDGKGIKLLSNVKASLIRGGKYKFYARIIED